MRGCDSSVSTMLAFPLSHAKCSAVQPSCVGEGGEGGRVNGRVRGREGGGAKGKKGWRVRGTEG